MRPRTTFIICGAIAIGGSIMALSQSEGTIAPTGPVISHDLMVHIMSDISNNEIQFDPNFSSIEMGSSENNFVVLNLKNEESMKERTQYFVGEIIERLQSKGHDPEKEKFFFCVWGRKIDVLTISGKSGSIPLGHSCYDPYADSATWVAPSDN